MTTLVAKGIYEGKGSRYLDKGSFNINHPPNPSLASPEVVSAPTTLDNLKESWNGLLSTPYMKGELGVDGDDSVRPLMKSIQKCIAQVAVNNLEVPLSSLSPSCVEGEKPEMKEERNTKIITSTAILAAAKDVAAEGDEEATIRILRPKMDPLEINSKENVAAAIFGTRYGSILLDRFIYKQPMSSITLLFLWMTGHVLGALSLFGVISPSYSLIGSALTIPTIIILGYFLLITQVVWMLLKRFDTW
jgi:hypothetical protein